MIDTRSFFNQLLPQYCVLCGGKAAADALCPACLDDLPRACGERCPRCALATPDAAVCGRCLRRPPAFDATCAAFDFRFPVDALLRRFKYHGMLALAETLGGMLLDAVPQNDLPDLLLPMPLHPQRLQERGFNQAAEIARHLARRLAIPSDNIACRRLRPTPPQAGLSLKERLRNLRGAFDCGRDLAGRHVALVDDVMTTGASLNALAVAVKQAGAVRVDCWVIARAQRD